MKYLLTVETCAIVALCCSGCGNCLAHLQGTVTVDGAPAPAGLSLQFNPVESGGSPSYASTDDQGHYEAAFTFQRKGIQPGEHVVRLIPGDNALPMPKIGPDGKPEPRPAVRISKLPQKYYEEIQTIQVESGSNSIDIDLKTAGN